MAPADKTGRQHLPNTGILCPGTDLALQFLGQIRFLGQTPKIYLISDLLRRISKNLERMPLDGSLMWFPSGKTELFEGHLHLQTREGPCVPGIPLLA